MTETLTSRINPITFWTADTFCCQMLWLLPGHVGINGELVIVTTIMQLSSRDYIFYILLPYFTNLNVYITYMVTWMFFFLIFDNNSCTAKSKYPFLVKFMLYRVPNHLTFKNNIRRLLSQLQAFKLSNLWD